jgi:hypothetical protein
MRGVAHEFINRQSFHRIKKPPSRVADILAKNILNYKSRLSLISIMDFRSILFFLFFILSTSLKSRLSISKTSKCFLYESAIEK